MTHSGIMNFSRQHRGSIGRVMAIALVAGCGGCAKWGMVELPPALEGLVQDSPVEQGGAALEVSTAVRVPSSGVAAIAFEIDGYTQIVLDAQAVGPFDPDHDRLRFEVGIDTGAPAALSLTYAAGRVVRPWLRRGWQMVYSPVGARRKYKGAILEINVGDASLGPVAVLMDAKRYSGRPFIGLDFLRQFDGVIFDWRRREILLLRGDSEAAIAARFPDSAQWCEVPLLSICETITSAPFPRGEAEVSRLTSVDLIAVEVMVGDEHVVAVIDTGGSGDVLALRDDLPVAEESNRHRAAGRTDSRFSWWRTRWCRH